MPIVFNKHRTPEVCTQILSYFLGYFNAVDMLYTFTNPTIEINIARIIIEAVSINI